MNVFHLSLSLSKVIMSPCVILKWQWHTWEIIMRTLGCLFYYIIRLKTNYTLVRNFKVKTRLDSNENNICSRAISWDWVYNNKMTLKYCNNYVHAINDTYTMTRPITSGLINSKLLSSWKWITSTLTFLNNSPLHGLSRVFADQCCV